MRAESIHGTLFFAGEATDITGNGTVHGAIARGLRAAKEIAGVYLLIKTLVFRR